MTHTRQRQPWRHGLICAGTPLGNRVAHITLDGTLVPRENVCALDDREGWVLTVDRPITTRIGVYRGQPERAVALTIQHGVIDVTIAPWLN